jgi:hypothetical protein
LSEPSGNEKALPQGPKQEICVAYFQLMKQPFLENPVFGRFEEA